MFICWILFLAPLVQAQIRFCEVSGSCRQCPDKRYTYYRCNTQRDCLNGETCNEGFCCPNILNHQPLSLPQYNQTSPAEKPVTVFPTRATEPFPLPPLFLRDNTIVAQNNDVDEKCGDGSDWTYRCKMDADCSGFTICMEGKCCRTCSTRRREILDKLATTEILGRSIPQCTLDGKYYREKQCFAGTVENCWCVSKTGRKLPPSDMECQIQIRRKESYWARKAQILKDELKKNDMKNCTISRDGSCPKLKDASFRPAMYCRCDEDCYGKKKCCNFEDNNSCADPVASTDDVTLLCASNEQFSACHSPCQPTCEDPAILPCPSPTCQAGCHCQPGFVRRDGSPHSPCISKSECTMFDVTSQCSDQRREYQGCGSSCPISCQTRNNPRCHERCVTGCFCRVPFILENSEDPLNSKCILASECPPVVPILPVNQHSMRDSYSQFPIIANEKTYNPYAQYYPAHSSTEIAVIPNTNRCADSLKNYLSCGTKCPVGCNAVSPSVSCTLDCVPGCFCHAPYILIDASDHQSACVLPQNCPRVDSSHHTCADPRKEYSVCGAGSCARSCSNLLGRCESSQCSSGCICREPYVLQDPEDNNSRCVLPSECERRCEDPMKEFITCGSSCPMACDNRHPKSCTPCQTGCYCKNGLVFKNSSDWQNSSCVRIDDCPKLIEETIEDLAATSTSSSTESLTTRNSETSVTTTIEKFTETTQEVTTSLTGLMIDKTLAIVPSLSAKKGFSDNCPSTTLDVGGRSCNSDRDCPKQQHCCQALIASLGVNPQRCSCGDPLAVWSTCGSLCPEYCGQPSVPVCSSTCNPGCQCANGYIRARNDITAPCIPREACESAKDAFQLNDTPRAIIKEIPTIQATPEETSNRLVASATLEGQILSGRLNFNKSINGQLRIEGKLDGLPPGHHALILHKFGDSTRDCSRIGPPHLITTLTESNPAIIDIDALGSNIGLLEFSSTVNWPLQEIIGRSVAIYGMSRDEWLNKPLEERPLACATVGLTYA
ncbi:unnamed protein product [Auanema sp. JU1783]|nr:unnamed protein product [Auanema sp. JU1783]